MVGVNNHWTLVQENTTGVCVKPEVNDELIQLINVVK